MIEQKCFICWWTYAYYLTWKDFDKQATAKIFKVYKCVSCWVEKIFPEPTLDEIITFYSKDYYSFHIKEEYKNSFLYRQLSKIYQGKHIIMKHFLMRWKMWIPYQKPEKWYFLDIGCWDGYMVDMMKSLGRESYGFEIGDKKRAGNIIYENDLSDADFWEMKFDFIRVAHVLEHIANPIQFLQKIKSIVKKEWIIEFTLPNTKSFDAKIFGKYRSNRDIPRHLINYNIDNLSIFFRNQWYKIIKKRYLLWFWLSWSIRHLLKEKYPKRARILDNKWVVFLLLCCDFILSLVWLWDHMGFRITVK